MSREDYEAAPDGNFYGPQPRGSDRGHAPVMKPGALPPRFVIRQANRGPYGRYLGPGTYRWHVWCLVTPRVPFNPSSYREGAQPQWRYIAQGTTLAAALAYIDQQHQETP